MTRWEPSPAPRGSRNTCGLVLAHPADDVVRFACKAIQQDLEILDLTAQIELREPRWGSPCSSRRDR